MITSFVWVYISVMLLNGQEVHAITGAQFATTSQEACEAAIAKLNKMRCVKLRLYDGSADFIK